MKDAIKRFLETYTANYSCGNCGYVFREQLPKGQRAPENAECRNCGCTASKCWPSRRHEFHTVSTRGRWASGLPWGGLG